MEYQILFYCISDERSSLLLRSNKWHLCLGEEFLLTGHQDCLPTFLKSIATFDLTKLGHEYEFLLYLLKVDFLFAYLFIKMTNKFKFEGLV